MGYESAKPNRSLRTSCSLGIRFARSFGLNGCFVFSNLTKPNLNKTFNFWDKMHVEWESGEKTQLLRETFEYYSN